MMIMMIMMRQSKNICNIINTKQNKTIAIGYMIFEMRSVVNRSTINLNVRIGFENYIILYRII